MLTALLIGIALLCVAIYANEVTVNASIEYDDGVEDESDSVIDMVLTSAGKRYTKHVQTIGTSEEALDLGDITSVGAIIIQNMDETNYVEIKDGTGGTIIAYLKPDTTGDKKGGVMMMSRAGSGFQAPWAIANTAACKIRIFLVEQ